MYTETVFYILFDRMQRKLQVCSAWPCRHIKRAMEAAGPLATGALTGSGAARFLSTALMTYGL